MTKKILTILVIIIALGIGYAGGKITSSHNKTPHSKRSSLTHNSTHKKGSAMSGTVLSDSGSNLTIQLPNGNTETVYTSNSTTYSQLSTITSSSIIKGSTITIFGSKNSNGSLTAKKIELK